MATPIYPIDLVITSIEQISAFDLLTGDFLFVVDELQKATISQTQDSNDITGKQGRKLAKIKRNKAVTISGDSGMVSGGLLAMQTGGNFENGEVTVKWIDYLTVKDGKVTTTYKAVGTEGAEIHEIDMKDEHGVVVKKLTQAASATGDNFKYDPTTREVTFATANVKDGTEVTVTYNRKIKAMNMKNHSDAYSSKCTLYIDAMGEDKCGNVYRVQFYVPKADFSGEFSFEMGDSQTIQSFSAEALSGACGAGGVLFDITVFGVDTEDVI